MEMVLNKNFSELSSEEIQIVEGGGDGFLGFLGDIYDGWCDMWHDFGENLYYMTH